MSSRTDEIVRWEATSSLWQKVFCDNLDEMVDQFLDFPDDVPYDLRDRQFARHLLWHIEDEQKMFRKLFMRGAVPFDFSNLWKRLMPYIDGRFPEYIYFNDEKLMQFSNGMYLIVHDLIVYHITSFDQLLNQLTELIRTIRNS